MKNKISLLFFLICITINAQNKDMSDVFQREFLKINSYPVESVAEYYSDLINFLMTKDTKEKNRKFGYISKNGKVFKTAEFDYASDFKGDYANVVKDSIPGLLFKNGKTKYFPDYSITYWNEDDLGLVIQNEKYGFINRKGKIIVPLIYDDAFPFYNGFASVKKGKKWFYIDKNGNELQFLEKFETSYKPILSNLVLVSDDKKNKLKKGQLKSIATGLTEFLTNVKASDYPENLYDIQNNKLLVFSDYDEISGYFENGLMKVVKNGKIGYVNKDNKIIIPLIYDQVKNISENKIIAEKDGFWGAIDLNNLTIIPFEYKHLNPFHEDLAFFSKDTNSKKIGYINSSNQIVIQPDLEFCWHGNFSNGIAVAKKDGKFGYIDKKGIFFISNIYKEAFPFRNNIALVKLGNNEKFTFINEKGESIINKEYKQLYPIKNGFARFVE
ncbi:WG repeat-containing protein [Flavobacterium sp. CHNK8]|uniref:WG repeat-containing protein n=1 Tax=Flavobacterium sp. CHNK8 TaxID=2871165 RepID=UPI001C8EDCB1|nr:WG repeat-containing protein [Flavobacterium sp. CHNK8]QZK91043.1 WG repeat-containing protein [Flavobacterium sp. CHNK8]